MRRYYSSWGAGAWSLALGVAYAQGTLWGDSIDILRPQGRLTTPTIAREAQEYAA